MTRRSPVETLRSDRTVQAVLAVVVLALVARLAFLGQRVAHQDEARVGYWIVRYLVNGQFEYRPIVHGPFLFVVNRYVFAILGPSDFAGRLVVALLGSALPGAALLFRHRLGNVKTVALSLFLAFNPILLYFSRFMRVDLPLAVFMLFTVGLWVRAYDSQGRRRFTYALSGATTFGLAFTTKENAILYLACWIGALVLLADQELFAAAIDENRSVVDLVETQVDRLGWARIGAIVAILAANPGVVYVAGMDSSAPTALVVLAAAAATAVASLVVVRDATPYHLLAPVAFVGVVAGTALVDDLQEVGVFALYWGLAATLVADRLLFGAFVATAARTSSERPVSTDPAAVETDGGPGEGEEDPATVASGAGAPGATEESARPGSTDAGVTDAESDGLDPGDVVDDIGATFAGDWYRRVPPTLVGAVLFLAVVVFFYAPRGGGYAPPTGTADGAGLWIALRSLDPVMFGHVVWEATFGTWTEFYGTWVGGGHQDHGYLPFLGDFVRTLGVGGAVLSLFAVVGFVVDRYTGDGPTPLIAFAAYWGFASVAGYPLVTDIAAPWTTVHAIVPLAIPATVPVAILVQVGRESLADDDAVSVVATVLLTLLIVGYAGFGAVSHVYLNPQGTNNELAQYAQSSSTDMHPVMDDVQAVAGGNSGTDVIFYGSEWSSRNESDHDTVTAGSGWFQRLPVMWYLEAAEYRLANDGDPATELVVDSTDDPQVIANSSAPVVVAFADIEGGVEDDESDVRQYLGGYSRWQGHRFLYDTGHQSSIVVYVDTSRIRNPVGNYNETISGSARLGPISTGH